MRETTLVEEDSAAVVGERDAVGFREDRFEGVGGALNVVDDGVAETEVREGEVDFEGGIGEKEERIAF